MTSSSGEFPLAELCLAELRAVGHGRVTESEIMTAPIGQELATATVLSEWS